MDNRRNDFVKDLDKCREELDATVTELSNKYEELVLLYDISESLGSLQNVSQLTDLILKKAVEHTNADNGILFLLDKGKGVLNIKGMYGIDWLDPEKYVVRIGHWTVGKVAAIGNPIIQNDIQFAGIENGKPITALLCVPLKAKDEVIGVISVAHGEKGKIFTSVEQKLLSTLASQAAVALENARLYEETKKMFLSIIDALAATIDAKDPYTHGHSKRVTYYGMVIAEAIGATPEFVETVKLAGLLHDVGKIGIPESVLSKAGSLTDEEYKTMMDHPVIGVRILGHINALKHVIPAMKHHHERYGGGGYPDGLKGEDIPLAARILSIADTFDAMTTDRPYRKALSNEEALRELGKNQGSQFDPELVRVFTANWKRKVMGKKDLGIGI
ncbi:MAG: HD-GYP domain-containing protein [Deltaproteobacteria bacterium]|nr:HD-GYP domain-containing protein [Deltaproteobacteria bacterium]